MIIYCFKTFIFHLYIASNFLSYPPQQPACISAPATWRGKTFLVCVWVFFCWLCASMRFLNGSFIYLAFLNVILRNVENPLGEMDFPNERFLNVSWYVFGVFPKRFLHCWENIYLYIYIYIYEGLCVYIYIHVYRCKHNTLFCIYIYIFIFIYTHYLHLLN